MASSPTARMILTSSASTLSLAQLAKMADGIVEVANPPAVASVAATSTSLDEVHQLTETLSRLVAALDSTEEDRKKFDTVMEKLDGFFQVRKNVIFERARFNCRNQREGESARRRIGGRIHYLPLQPGGQLPIRRSQGRDDP